MNRARRLRRRVANCVAAVMGVVVLVLAHASTAMATELYVVVHANNPVKSLDANQVVRLFTGRDTVFAHGASAQAYDQARDSAARQQFYQRLLGQSLERVNSYWAQLQLTGHVRPPIEMEHERHVVAALRRDTAGIGYLTVPPNDASLRIALVLPAHDKPIENKSLRSARAAERAR